MKNENINDYWAKREADHIKKQVKDDKVLAKRIEERQLKAMDEIQEQIDAFYGRYATTEGITIQEAKKRVAKIDMEKYQKKAKKYVEGAHSSVESIAAQSFTKIANEEMRLYNLTMKVNRLELLKMNIELEVIAATSDIEHYLFKEFNKYAIEEYERLSGILGETINYNEKHVKSIVDSSFMNAEWSERLWGDSAALRSELDTLLHRGIIQGKNPKVLARDLRKKFDVSVYESERLMRTEMARVQQDVFQDSAKQVGVAQYKYIAEPDACDKCAALDSKVFDFEDAEIGINAYPMHPQCRCSQSMYVDRDEWDRKLKERGL